ncbi:DUF2238 domain-containing protein [Candidatus Pacearchaeota archaeon]|nr:DUF2238 domain-containing protein [Candidatus Pacearchaeota archaeon]
MKNQFLKKGQLIILITLIASLLIFSIIALNSKNYEFVLYIGVILFFFFLILLTNHKHNVSNGVLWGLVLWAILHMSGGLLYIGGEKIYAKVLINLFTVGGEAIFRYDQLVHVIGFGIATLVVYDLTKNYFNKKTNWKVLSVILVLAGMGIGVVNEILEFIAVLILPETGVGGYYNTLLDLISNTIGAIIAVSWLNWKRKKSQ